MRWIIFVILGLAGLIVLFILLTDGRYFGKRLMWWVYDRVGPLIFGAQSEGERWRTLVDALRLQGDESVLDVGTAVGDLPLTLAAMPGFQGQVVGVDWSQKMIQAATHEARRRGLQSQVNFRVADLRHGLPFTDGSFDVVFCLGLLETMPRPERALRELRRVLAPRGIMVLSLYRQGWSSRIVALSLQWYEECLAQLGLGNLHVAPCRSSHDVVIARPAAPS